MLTASHEVHHLRQFFHRTHFQIHIGAGSRAGQHPRQHLLHQLPLTVAQKFARGIIQIIHEANLPRRVPAQQNIPVIHALPRQSESGFHPVGIFDGAEKFHAKLSQALVDTLLNCRLPSSLSLAQLPVAIHHVLGKYPVKYLIQIQKFPEPDGVVIPQGQIHVLAKFLCRRLGNFRRGLGHVGLGHLQGVLLGLFRARTKNADCQSQPEIY